MVFVFHTFLSILSLLEFAMVRSTLSSIPYLQGRRGKTGTKGARGRVGQKGQKVTSMWSHNLKKPPLRLLHILFNNLWWWLFVEQGSSEPFECFNLAKNFILSWRFILL